MAEQRLLTATPDQRRVLRRAWPHLRPERRGIVLDEATADIDPGTARTREAALDALRADRTLIVIAHR